MDVLLIFVVLNPVLGCPFLHSYLPMPVVLWCVFYGQMQEYIHCKSCELSGIAGGHISQCVLAVHLSDDQEVAGGLGRNLSVHSPGVSFSAIIALTISHGAARGLGGRFPSNEMELLISSKK